MDDNALNLFLMSKSTDDMIYLILTGGIMVRGGFKDWGKHADCLRITVGDSNVSGFQLGVTLTIPFDSIVAWGEMEP